MHVPKLQFNINLRCGEFNNFIWCRKIVKKYLQHGYTQMEVDSTYSTVERTFRYKKMYPERPCRGGGGWQRIL